MQDPAADHPPAGGPARVHLAREQLAREHRPSLQHRPEIDGLRSFAILPILLLHCGVPGLRGGFVGVDVFFVISGYLITAIIHSEIAGGSFSLARFYRRRIVRILPALVLMIAVVLALGCAILLPIPLRDLGRSAAATAAFGSNIYFYATVDYFYSDLTPLVHTWSLAVEEQFYVLYPLLLMATRKLSRERLVVLLAALSVASLAVGGYFAMTDPAAGFYLLPARVWELLAGALVALGAYPRVSRRWAAVLSWFGLLAILACVVAIKPSWPFPVPFALPVAGSALMLIAYSPGTVVARVLSWTPLRWIGLISYSLYLWHRPIIALYLQGRSEVLTIQDALVLLPLCFAAAIASYLLVERPALRRWRSGTGLLPHAWAVLTLGVVAAAGLLIAAQAERIRPLPPEVARVAGYLRFDKTPAGRAQYATDRCFALPTHRPNDPACLLPEAGRDNVLLVGDSHAAQLSQALSRAIAPAHLMQATAAGCRPVLEGRGLASCRTLTLQALKHADLARISAVVLAGRWFASDAPLLADTVRALRARGARRVIVVGPVVEYDADVPDLLARSMLAHDFTRMEQVRLADRAPLDRTLRKVASEAGARYVSHFAIECPQGRCLLFTADGGPRHIDHSHLTPLAAQPVAEAIRRAIAD
ncbi:peptidoglycan/LPS O-acetylase OafA/YrhL [Novosphingobium chloroacetimidivorans]|uniref:Peptidoglycan/LPS O-acetylase OafA/YrhL n=1 Tax=Novosphingobium chloroacetimidivorans TaxID=1428314 RepID=A0A7W7K7N9_9SPHN|nr:acyltransferase family protein [Novosphingobium chloroacetimidivorans]MBB4857244.1 peptidoglycan/LPS O-acetylase OafA/YrhL [Novosphingobium chloroacetimidivorans]